MAWSNLSTRKSRMPTGNPHVYLKYELSLKNMAKHVRVDPSKLVAQIQSAENSKYLHIYYSVVWMQLSYT